MTPRRLILCGLGAVACTALHAGDWPMLGGRPERNMVAAEKGLPVAKGPREAARPPPVKWTAQLGRVTFGSPVISEGRVFIGTDNDEPGATKKRGVLKCLSERDGAVLWRVVHEKLPQTAEDDGTIGICSTPCVDGDAVYYVSNRGELVCRAVADGRERWLLDLRATLGVSPNQASASSPLVLGDLVFVVTGNGRDYKTGAVKNPAAPSFIAVHRSSGKIAWQDSSPGPNILTGQWGSPGAGVVDDVTQVAFPGGDGWLYSFAAETGKLLWKFNCKAHEKTAASGEPDTTFQVVAAPVFAGNRVYVTIGEPEAGTGPGALRCIDARQRGDITKTGEIWRLGGDHFSDSLSMAAVHESLVYAVDTPGFLSCIDGATGRRLWSHDLKANVWGSPLVADDKVYVQSAEGVISIFATGREMKLLGTISSLPDVAHGTPVAANGVLYITGQKQLYALATQR